MNTVINTTDIYSDEIKRLVAIVDNAQMKNNDEVREFIYSLTKLVYDYKMIGKIYDFYPEEVEYYKQNKIIFTHVEEVVRDVAHFLAAFPNLKTNIENIIVHKESDSFYKVSKRLRYWGNNYGHSKFGPPTGRSLETRCLSQSLIHLKKEGETWKIVFEINNDSELWLEEVLGAGRNPSPADLPESAQHTPREGECVQPDLTEEEWPDE